MSAYETETHENLKSDAERCITAIRTQMLTILKVIENADFYQGTISKTLYESTSALVPTSDLVDEVKAMLVHTCNLKVTAALIHENTLKLDHTLTQLETLEKEAENE